VTLRTELAVATSANRSARTRRFLHGDTLAAVTALGVAVQIHPRRGRLPRQPARPRYRRNWVRQTGDLLGVNEWQEGQ
jgi:hypothetical protein